MALRVVARCREVSFDGTTIVIPVTLRLAGQNDDVGHEFTGVVENIANAAAVLPYLKTQIVNFIQSHYSQAVTAAEVTITGAPQ